MTFLRRLREDEDGFSLTELLTAMVIGGVVLWALMTLMTTGLTKSLEVSDRADAAQTGRGALDRMVTLLDSSICLDPVTTSAAVPPLIGSAAAVTGPPAIPAQTGSDGSYAAFYADLAGVSDSPDKYTLTYDATAKSLTERRFNSTGTLPNITIPSTATETRVLATNVVPARDSLGVQLPVFRYYKFESDGSINPASPVATPVTQALAGQPVRVVITFQVISGRTNREDRRSTTIEGQSALGTPDPSLPNAGSCP
jgi:prepilin-type N-terminal cleavage/methylation domain-containing protein